jgi:hypothetical protein
MSLQVEGPAATVDLLLDRTLQRTAGSADILRQEIYRGWPSFMTCGGNVPRTTFERLCP